MKTFVAATVHYDFVFWAVVYFWVAVDVMDCQRSVSFPRIKCCRWNFLSAEKALLRIFFEKELKKFECLPSPRLMGHKPLSAHEHSAGVSRSVFPSSPSAFSVPKDFLEITRLQVFLSAFCRPRPFLSGRLLLLAVTYFYTLLLSPRLRVWRTESMS